MPAQTLQDDQHLIDVLHDDLERGFAPRTAACRSAFRYIITPSEVQVGAVINFTALGLLRRDIVHRADGLLYHAGLLRGSERGNAEIGQLFVPSRRMITFCGLTS